MPDTITKILLVFAMLVLLIFCGLFLYLILLYEKKKRAKFIEYAVETEGIVENRGLSIIHPSFYHLEYSYFDKNQQKYKASELMGVLVLKYKKGEKITVYYDQTNPKRSLVKLKQKGR